MKAYKKTKNKNKIQLKILKWKDFQTVQIEVDIYKDEQAG
jgi:hypothetical protein